MKPLLLLALATASPTVADHPKTFLASIEGVRLRSGESIDKFEIGTWGVGFKALCHIPADWEITAGSFGPGGNSQAWPDMARHSYELRTREALGD